MGTGTASTMKYETKRTLSFLIVGGYLFLGGCEYGKLLLGGLIHVLIIKSRYKTFNILLAVIFPTCLSYLKSLGADDEYWLGFTVSGKSHSSKVIDGHSFCER